MDTVADVVHFFANKFAGLSGGRFALLLVAFGASNGFLFGHKKLLEIRGQSVIWGRAILSGDCLSAEKPKGFTTEGTEITEKTKRRRGIPRSVRNDRISNEG